MFSHWVLSCAFVKLFEDVDGQGSRPSTPTNRSYLNDYFDDKVEREVVENTKNTRDS